MPTSTMAENGACSTIAAGVVSVDASDEQINEIAIEMENEPSFYNPSRLFHFMEGRRFVVSLAEDDLSIPTYRPEE